MTIDLRGRSAMADHMVIASGRSARQVGASLLASAGVLGIIGGLAAATLVVGSILAVVQSDVKRMMAYSSFLVL